MREGLVGTSQWARAMHGASANAHPDVELVAVWGRDRDKTASAATDLGTAAAATFELLLDSVDAVVFSVPPAVQVPLAIEAAEAGKHLLLEKPLALDVESGRSLVEAASGVRTAVFFTRVWAPRSAEWLDGLREKGGWDCGRAAMVSALSAELLSESPWRADKGALWDVGPHALSVLERVLGPVTSIRAFRGVRDLVHLVLTHADGATSTAELTLTAPADAAHGELSFWGPSGRSEPVPPLGLPDALEAGQAALSSLLDPAKGMGLDAGYGLHVTELLAEAEAQLS
jgi:predicted dehydrogenase